MATTSELESNLHDSVDCCVLISLLEKKRFHLTGLITLVLLMWKWIDLEEKEEKLSFKIFGLTFPSKLYWSSYIISIAKSVSKKIGALICAVKFLSPGVVLYL